MNTWIEKAPQLDSQDPVRSFRDEFILPGDTEPYRYFVGNSLGLQPKRTAGYVNEVLEDWGRLGVMGHFDARHPWFPYHENLTGPMAEVVGALPDEVVVMNTLTANLHLLMASFYRPTGSKERILMLGDGFPSDRYAVMSQLRLHERNAQDHLIALKPRTGDTLLRHEDILEVIEREGASIAMILLESVHYRTGQAFRLKELAEAAHEQGIVFGVDLAHGAGNLHLKLHDWGVDFAAWCSYKYLNASPGGLAGCFIHQKWAKDPQTPRLAGWWGHNKETRFRMDWNFDPIQGADGWQLSNPPILPMAALRASLEIFHEAGMDRLRAKSVQLTGYLEEGLRSLGERVSVLSPTAPDERGCQLSVRIEGAQADWIGRFKEKGVVLDFREPDVFRLAPVPLYNSFQDVADLVSILQGILQES